MCIRDSHWAAQVVGTIELHIDSDNNSRKENWAPDRTVEERSIRNDPDKPGRLVAVDNGDSDHDGIIDYADMKHLNKFVRMELDISKVAMAMDRGQAKVRFEYSGSDPLKMGPDNVPAAGVMRIWTFGLRMAWWSVTGGQLRMAGIMCLAGLIWRLSGSSGMGL